MASEITREKFEAWAVSDAASCGYALSIKRNEGWYWPDSDGNNHLNTAWAAWQASRAALVIELPRITYKQNPDVETDIEARIRNDMRTQLIALGVEFK